MIELIVTDLDNTLLNSRKEISDYTAETLKKCRSKGVKIAFATARPERATMKIQKMFQPDYVISNNGATISCKGNVIYNNPIPEDMLNSLISSLKSTGTIGCLTAEAGEYLYTDYQGEPWDNENWNTIYNDFSEHISAEISKISIQYKNAQVVENLISNYHDLHLYMNSGEDWCQVMHKASAKMNAVYRISEITNIKIENIAAFGDDFNDIEMIEKCGIGVAVENAVSSAKQVADYICKSNNDNGVAEWIESNIHLLNILNN